jgi:catechol-2,3-dioxygenase
MITAEIVIAVKDVRASASWYEQLLGCRSSHGGDTFEILRNEEGQRILCLHRWAAHDHPTLSNPALSPGNGMILYFRTDKLEEAWENAKKLNAVLEEEPHLNANSGQREFSLRDNDNYYISITEPE